MARRDLPRAALAADSRPDVSSGERPPRRRRCRPPRRRVRRAAPGAHGPAERAATLTRAYAVAGARRAAAAASRLLGCSHAVGVCAPKHHRGDGEAGDVRRVCGKRRAVGAVLAAATRMRMLGVVGKASDRRAEPGQHATVEEFTCEGGGGRHDVE